MKKRWPLLSTATAVSAYLTWTVVDRAPPAAEPRPSVVEAVVQGGGRPTLVAASPRLDPRTYVEADAFARAIDDVLHVARVQGALAPGAVAVLPAHVGTGLVLVGEKASVVDEERVGDAFRLVALANLPAWLPRRIARSGDGVAILRMKAAAAARAYHRALSSAARTYGVAIVGGSIVLPEPAVRDGVVVVGRGPLVEATFVYRPDGSAAPQIGRRAARDEAGLPSAPAPAWAPLVVDTAAGRVGVLVSSDANDPAAYEALAGRIDLLAVPSAAIAGAEGASVAVVAARARATGARAAVVAAQRGTFYELRGAGASAAILGTTAYRAPDVEAAVAIAAAPR